MYMNNANMSNCWEKKSRSMLREGFKKFMENGYCEKKTAPVFQPSCIKTKLSFNSVIGNVLKNPPISCLISEFDSVQSWLMQICECCYGGLEQNPIVEYFHK